MFVDKQFVIRYIAVGIAVSVLAGIAFWFACDSAPASSAQPVRTSTVASAPSEESVHDAVILDPARD